MGTPFIRWLHDEAVADLDRHGHFVDLYPFGPYFDNTFGVGDPEMAVFASYLERKEYSPADVERLCGLLTLAVATWRTDTSEIASGTSDVVLRQPPCGFRGVDGIQCKDPTVPGAARCARHGGAITDPQTRASLLLVAYAQLVTGAETAVETLLSVMEHSTNDIARVQAAKEMLDRAGLTVDQRIQVTSTEASETREDIVRRIVSIVDSTRDRLLPTAPEVDDDEILEGELVE